LFKKRDKSFQDIESVIAAGVEIKGDINSQGSMRVDGNIEGKVYIKGDLILGEKGRIKGEVRAGNLLLAGRIEGNANTSGRLEITPSGYMNGDISCNTIIIEEGGALDGSSRMPRHKDKNDAEKTITPTVFNRKTP